MTLTELITQAAQIWKQRELWTWRLNYTYRLYNVHVSCGSRFALAYRQEAIYYYVLMLRCDGDLQRLQEQYETEHPEI